MAMVTSNSTIVKALGDRLEKTVPDRTERQSEQKAIRILEKDANERTPRKGFKAAIVFHHRQVWGGAYRGRCVRNS
ncbi:MAG: hypothetical protein NTW36_14695 [Planctomycetia bacterium]|nr:hypothetical protein [Planctomycetia bacterium]